MFLEPGLLPSAGAVHRCPRSTSTDGPYVIDMTLYLPKGASAERTLGRRHFFHSIVLKKRPCILRNVLYLNCCGFVRRDVWHVVALLGMQVRRLHYLLLEMSPTVLLYGLAPCLNILVA